MHILLIFSIEILMKEKQKERRIDDVKSHRRLHAVRQAIRCNSWKMAIDVDLKTENDV